MSGLAQGNVCSTSSRCVQVAVLQTRVRNSAAGRRRDGGATSRRALTLVRSAATVEAPETQPTTTNRSTKAGLKVDANQAIREGHYEASLVQLQASKQDVKQRSIAQVLPAFDPALGTVEHVIVGCGPAGLALAAEVAAQGIEVVLIGADAPFVNNYGVWVDEWEALGLGSTLDHRWTDAACWFGEGKEVRVGRPYGRVCRRALRELLLDRCAESGVRFLAGEVLGASLDDSGDSMTLTCAADGAPAAGDQAPVRARLVTLASGAAAGRLLEFEAGAPGVAAQTAYGIEAEVEGYGESYDDSSMLFMDFRRHHTGLWDDTAGRLVPGLHPNSGDGLWGTSREVPSFLYAMPLSNGKVFLEETCLVAKPALPFATLKRRLYRRLEAMGVKVTRVEEEEWSYIPVGGPLPVGDQALTAFGAAANLVHPATGYSITRSLREAGPLAKQIAAALRKGRPVRETSAEVWDALWNDEKRRQAAFHVFGMELLVVLDLNSTNAFFRTFFRLPPKYWRGFLASDLTSGQLLVFAMLTFLIAPPGIKAGLVNHLATHPAGKYLIDKYLAAATGNGGESTAATPLTAARAAALMLAAAAMAEQQQA